MPRNKPDFFIIGAPKCGTTTLYSWLKQHPGIFMPDSKEPHYFAQNLSDRYCRIRSEENYLDLFKEAQAGQICGEASVLYGFYPQSIQEILDFNPKAKFIFMLRHPVDMIVSYHAQLLVNLEEDEKNFENAWRLQQQRAQGKHIPTMSQDPDLLQYKKIGQLGHYLKNVRSLLPKEKCLFLLLDNMIKDPQRLHADVLEFIGASPRPLENYTKENEASALRSAKLQAYALKRPLWVRAIARTLKVIGIKPNAVLRFLNRKKSDKKQISTLFRKELETTFQDDIETIETLFSHKFT